jgi:hypothetical protein
MGSCEKRISRLEADDGSCPSLALPLAGPPTRAGAKDEEDEEGSPEEESGGGGGGGGGTVSKVSAGPATSDSATGLKRPRFRRYNKDRADKALGKLYCSLRHIQTFIGKHQLLLVFYFMQADGEDDVSRELLRLCL